jgi:hypothetical protein
VSTESCRSRVELSDCPRTASSGNLGRSGVLISGLDCPKYESLKREGDLLDDSVEYPGVWLYWYERISVVLGETSISLRTTGRVERNNGVYMGPVDCLLPRVVALK